MPSSYVTSVEPIVSTLIAQKTRTVLDIGPGWSKYGLMCREYCHKLRYIDAVEVPEGRKPIQDCIYDRVIEADIRTFPEDVERRDYQIALMIDVIEHMTLDQGKDVLTWLIRQNMKVLVSTPKVFIEQHDPNNPHEEHLSLWTWEDLAPFGTLADVSTTDSIIYLVGKP